MVAFIVPLHGVHENPCLYTIFTQNHQKTVLIYLLMVISPKVFDYDIGRVERLEFIAVKVIFLKNYYQNFELDMFFVFLDCRLLVELWEECF